MIVVDLRGPGDVARVGTGAGPRMAPAPSTFDVLAELMAVLVPELPAERVADPAGIAVDR